MKLFLYSLLCTAGSLFYSSIYTHHFTTINGSEMHLSQFQGKKILVVNIASASDLAAVQLPELEDLYQQYKDSLVVLGFPSNDFGHEQNTDSALKLLLQDTYKITFPVAKITGINDSLGSVHPLYNWLQQKNQNGNSNAKVKGDFQKFLINGNGTIIGVYGAKISPLDTSITRMINQ